MYPNTQVWTKAELRSIAFPRLAASYGKHDHKAIEAACLPACKLDNRQDLSAYFGIEIYTHRTFGRVFETAHSTLSSIPASVVMGQINAQKCTLFVWISIIGAARFLRSSMTDQLSNKTNKTAAYGNFVRTTDKVL